MEESSRGLQKPVSAIEGVTAAAATMPKSYGQKQVVTRVYDSDKDGMLKVVQDVYLTTVYDSNGKISKVTTAHTVDYLV